MAVRIARDARAPSRPSRRAAEWARTPGDSERRVWARKREDERMRPMSRATRPSRTASSSASSSGDRREPSASSQRSARSRVEGRQRRRRHRDGVAPARRAQRRADEPALGTSRAGARERVRPRPHATQRSRRGRWPSRSTARGRRSTTATRAGGRVPPPARRSARTSSAEERGVGVALGREPGHASPPTHAASPEPLRGARAASTNGRDDVEVVDADQLAPPGVEEHQLAEREQLERAAEARAQPARRLGDAAHLAEVARVEAHQAIALPERQLPITTAAERAEAPCQEVRRKPNSRSALSSLRQLRRTCTVSSR